MAKKWSAPSNLFDGLKALSRQLNKLPYAGTDEDFNGAMKESRKLIKWIKDEAFRINENNEREARIIANELREAKDRLNTYDQEKPADG